MANNILSQDALDQRLERRKAIDGSRMLFELLRDAHGEGGRPDLYLSRKEIKGEIARRLHARRVAATRSREV